MNEAIFERTVEAVIDGKLDELQELLSANPALARARSAREHRATLLHYVAANGVEDDRQRTPANAVAIARALVQAGADVDATCEVYGGGDGTSVLCQLVTSAHPAAAGVQGDLTELLLDAGAQLEGLADDGKPLAWALAFGYTETAVLLASRGARVRNVVGAAGLGDLERVRAAFDDSGSLRDEEAHFSDLAFRSTEDPREVLGWALIYACQHGQVDVARFLIERKAPLDARGPQGFTPLHRAAWDGRREMLEVLLTAGAPLEAQNDYGGTVLDGTVFAAIEAPLPGVDYLPVLARLVEAGADTNAVATPTGNAPIDELLRSRR